MLILAIYFFIVVPNPQGIRHMNAEIVNFTNNLFKYIICHYTCVGILRLYNKSVVFFCKKQRKK